MDGRGARPSRWKSILVATTRQMSIQWYPLCGMSSSGDREFLTPLLFCVSLKAICEPKLPNWPSAHPFSTWQSVHNPNDIIFGLICGSPPPKKWENSCVVCMSNYDVQMYTSTPLWCIQIQIQTWTEVHIERAALGACFLHGQRFAFFAPRLKIWTVFFFVFGLPQNVMRNSNSHKIFETKWRFKKRRTFPVVGKRKRARREVHSQSLLCAVVLQTFFCWVNCLSVVNIVISRAS